MQTFCHELLFCIEGDGARGFSRLQCGHHFAEHIPLGDEFLVPAFGIALHAFEPLLRRLHIREHEFEVDDLNIPHRIGPAVDMMHILVVKHADDFGYGIHFADVREELIAQAFPLRSPFHQACDIHEFHRGGHFLCRMRHLCELIEAEIGHRNDADGRVYRAERIILRRHSLFCKRIKKRRLSDIG